MRRTALIIYFVLALVTLGLFLPVVHHEFVDYDDQIYITQNPNVRSGLTAAGCIWAFTTGYTANWHPLTWLSHMLDCQLFGLDPAGHHLVNVLFHILNSLLLLHVLRQLTGSLWRSAIVAALFAWHPLHVESVAWASERKDVLSACFWLLTMLAYVKYVRKPSAARYALALLCFALGLMSKPMVVTLPCVLLLLDFWPLKRTPLAPSTPAANGVISWTRLFLEKIPFFLLTAISCWITYLVQKSGGAVSTLQTVSLAQRLANTPIAYVRYLRKFFWPHDLAAMYPMVNSWPSAQIIGATLLLLLVTAVAAMQFRRRPWLIVGWLWFLGTLVPVIGLVQVGIQSMADRYSYIPLIGIFLMLVWTVAELKLPQYRPAVATATTLMLLACLAVTWIQIGTWRTSATLFTRANAVTPGNTYLHIIYGSSLFNSRRMDEALAQFDQALKIQPDSSEAFYGIGLVNKLQGNTAEALGFFNKALLYQPNLAKAQLEAGRLAQQNGNLDEALRHFTALLNADPENLEAHKSVGLILAQQGKVSDALPHFLAALKYEPENPDLHYAIALAQVLQGHRELAIQSFREALRLKPEWPEALNNLAWILATHPDPALRNGPEAVQLSELACRLDDNKEPSYLGTLDAAYAETGNFDQAILTAEKAKTLATTLGVTNLVTAADARLKEYHSGHPHHEP